MEFKCNNVTITLKNGKVIVENLSFILNKGDKLALIGEEGNGKSTLIKFLLNKKLIDDYCYYKGEVTCSGKIGYLRQTINEYSDYDVMTYFSINNDEIDYEIYNKEYLIKKLFNEFNLDTKILEENRSISSLSGGEKVKLQLIKLQLEEVDVLLLDEPSNDLDLATLEFLKNYLIKIDLPLIFVSHDEYLLENVANKILHLEQLRDLEKVSHTFMNTSYNEYLMYRNVKREKQNNKAYLQEKEIKRKDEILRRFKQNIENDMAKAVRDPIQGRLLAKKMKNIKSQERKLNIENDNRVKHIDDDLEINISFSPSLNYLNSSKVLVDLKNYILRIEDKILVKNVNLVIKGRDHVCIIGNNGCGKSTLLKVIKDIIVKDDKVRLGYFPQDYGEILDYDCNVIDYIQQNLDKDNLTKGKIMTYLSAFHFMEHQFDLKIRDLSIGEQGKVILIKLILEECNVLLLDEPTRNFSSLSRPKLLKVLNSFKGCIISVSHDLSFIKGVCDKLYLVNNKTLMQIDNNEVSNNNIFKIFDSN